MGNYHSNNSSYLTPQASAQATAAKLQAVNGHKRMQTERLQEKQMADSKQREETDLRAYQAQQSAEQLKSQERQHASILAHEIRMKELENADEERKRHRIDVALKETQCTKTNIDNTVRSAKKNLLDEEEARAKFEAEKQRLMSKIKRFSKYKQEQLQNYEVEIKLDIARRDYFRDRNEIENAIKTTGVHSDYIGKFLMLTHAMTGATMSTQAEVNRLDVALSIFGSIINNYCQDKLTIDYYFAERNLKDFIPILSRNGFETLNHMICEDEQEFEKDILTLLEKGIQKQQEKQKEDAENKIKEYKKMVEKEQIILNEKKITGEQIKINARIQTHQRSIEKQKCTLQELEDKATKREEQMKELGVNVDSEAEGQDLCVLLLEKWRLKQFWGKLQEEGWDDPYDWAEMDTEDLQNDVGMRKPGHIRKFMKNSKTWKEMSDKKQKEEKQKFFYLTPIQQRELKNICLRPQQTWKVFEKQMVKMVKKDLLLLSPILAEFFGRINEGVKITQELLNYKNELSDSQLKAVQLRNENDKTLKAIELRRTDYAERKILVKHSECEIYSDSCKQWCKGKVIDVKEDTDGVWLNIDYKVNEEIRTKRVQRYNNGIRPFQIVEQMEEKEEIMNDNDADDCLTVGIKSNPIVVQSTALIQASMVAINVTDVLFKEFTASPATERGLTLAISVEDCCGDIIRNQGKIRQSVFLAQEILKYKPANINDKKTIQFWKAIDSGIIRIFTSALEMVKVTAEYFGFLLRFHYSFKFFISCYHDDKDVSLFISLERLKQDLRDFNKFRGNFSNIVMQMSKTATEIIGNCVSQQIGHLNWEKTRKSVAQTEKIYLAKQELYVQKALELDYELDRLQESKALQMSKEATANAQCNILKSRITAAKAHYKQCGKQMNDLQRWLFKLVSPNYGNNNTTDANISQSECDENSTIHTDTKDDEKDTKIQVNNDNIMEQANNHQQDEIQTLNESMGTENKFYSLEQRLQQRQHVIHSLQAIQTELSNGNNQNAPQKLAASASGNNAHSSNNQNNNNNPNDCNQNQNNFRGNNHNNPSPSPNNGSEFNCNIPTHSILEHQNKLLTLENNKLKQDKIELERRLNQQMEFSRELASKLHQEKQFNLLTKIDLVLDKYYKSHGINDYLCKGIGKLSQYVTEKHLNDGHFSLYEEYEDKTKPKKIIYSDFDSTFPLPNDRNTNSVNSNLKEQMIFDIVQHCYLYNAPPKNPDLCNISSNYACNGKLKYVVQKSDPNNELTILDRLYLLMDKRDIQHTTLSYVNTFLDEEEYDSDALAIDILQFEKFDSNMAQKLLKNTYAHLLIKSFMQRNTKNCCSFPRNKIKLTSKLTKNIVPATINANVKDAFQYMNKFTSIYNNALIKCNEKLAVIDYNFCCNKTENKLYTIADRNQTENHLYSVWKVRETLYTSNEIEKLCTLSKMEFSQPFQVRYMIMEKLKQERDKIKFILQKPQEMKRLFSNKSIKWDGERVRICNKKTKSPVRKCFQLNKSEFSNRAVGNNMDEIKLVSIATFREGNYCFENLLIVELDDKIHVGISLTITSYRKKVPLLPKAIHLDISDGHVLCCEFGCNCLHSFICDIDELRIESETARLLQKNNILETNLYKAKIQLKSFENTIVQNIVDINGKHMKISELENKLNKKQRMMVKLDSALQTALKQLTGKQKEETEILNRICNQYFV